MLRNANYNRVLNSLKNCGYAHCEDYLVREWIPCSSIRKEYLRFVADAFREDIGCPVSVLYPARNPNSEVAHFFVMDKYLTGGDLLDNSRSRSVRYVPIA